MTFKRIFLRLFSSIAHDVLISFNQSQKQYLIKQLKFSGNNIFIQMPICIDRPECVEIGNDVSIAAFVHMWGKGGIKIGNRVMIASHTAITSLTHDYNQQNMFNTLVEGSVEIQDDVWIGTHSIILPGVVIGRGAVIGAGSIVTKDIEPYSVVVGAPARLHKYRSIKDKGIQKID